MDAGASGQSLLRHNVLESICNMDVLDTMPVERFQKNSRYDAHRSLLQHIRKSQCYNRYTFDLKKVEVGKEYRFHSGKNGAALKFGAAPFSCKRIILNTWLHLQPTAFTFPSSSASHRYTDANGG